MFGTQTLMLISESALPEIFPSPLSAWSCRRLDISEAEKSIEPMAKEGSTASPEYPFEKICHAGGFILGEVKNPGSTTAGRSPLVGFASQAGGLHPCLQDDFRHAAGQTLERGYALAVRTRRDLPTRDSDRRYDLVARGLVYVSETSTNRADIP